MRTGVIVAAAAAAIIVEAFFFVNVPTHFVIQFFHSNYIFLAAVLWLDYTLINYGREMIDKLE